MKQLLYVQFETSIVITKHEHIYFELLNILKLLFLSLYFKGLKYTVKAYEKTEGDKNRKKDWYKGKGYCQVLNYLCWNSQFP